MSTGDIRIQQGKFKGRRIPAPPRIKGALHVTPGLVKEAAFQLIENRVPEGAFIDLCAGSGQMGFEALSRGYDPVHFCEVEEERFRVLVEEVRKHGYEVELHRRDFRRSAGLILAQPVIVAYLDLPYSFWTDERCGPLEGFFADFWEDLAKADPGPRTILFVIQGPSFFKPPGSPPAGFQLEVSERQYRRTHLTLLELRGALEEPPAPTVGEAPQKV